MSISILGGEFTKTTFPGGETCIRVIDPGEGDDNFVTLKLKFESNNDLFDLALLVDALRRAVPGVGIKLYMPYVPRPCVQPWREPVDQGCGGLHQRHRLLSSRHR